MRLRDAALRAGVEEVLGGCWLPAAQAARSRSGSGHGRKPWDDAENRLPYHSATSGQSEVSVHLWISTGIFMAAVTLVLPVVGNGSVVRSIPEDKAHTW